MAKVELQTEVGDRIGVKPVSNFNSDNLFLEFGSVLVQVTRMEAKVLLAALIDTLVPDFCEDAGPCDNTRYDCPAYASARVLGAMGR